MTDTLSSLKTELATALKDPNGQTFDSAALTSLVNAGLAEVGRVLPQFYSEDISPVANAYTYILRSSVFSGVPQPEIELRRVELWDTTQTPQAQQFVLPEASASSINDSSTGWFNWGGTLYVPPIALTLVTGNEASWVYRTWGYSPYVPLSADGDTAAVGIDGKGALIAYARVEALRNLLASRELFSQWQTRSGNTDITPAGLMNALTMALTDWKSRSTRLNRYRTNF